RARQAAVQQPQAPLHGSAPLRRPHSRPRDQAQAHPARGRRAQPHQAAFRVPLPHALSHPGAELLGERAGPQGDLPRALGRLSGSRVARGLTIPRIRVGPVELFYQRTRPARPPSLVLIMGWGGDHTAWALQVAALAAEFDVIALDNRGAGQSDAPDNPYSMTGMADDVAGLMDELG